MAKNSAKKLLDNDDNVRRWYENMRRSSHDNADIRLRRLNLFCDQTNTTPSDLVDIGEKDPRDAENLLLDHVTWMEGKDYSPSYTEGVLKSIKAWLAYNHIEIKRKIRVSNAGMCATLKDEQVPDPAQLRAIFEAAPLPRCRAVISLMAFSGVRPQVMGLSDASDGLRVADLPDLVIDGKNVSFARVPAMVVVRPNLSKTRNKYVTFLGAEGCRHVSEYLRQRLAQGDKLGSDSPLIAVIKGQRTKGWRNRDPDAPPFLKSNAIANGTRSAIRSVIKARPYILRSYFDSQLLVAESHGCMTHAYRQFFMGHKGDIEARYTTNKGRLTEQMREDMRRSYDQSQVFLYPDVHKGGDSDMVAKKKRMLQDMWRRQAEMHGLDPDDMIGGGGAPGGTGGQNAGGGAGAAKDPEPPDGRHHPSYESRIAQNEEDLVSCCADGWDMIRELQGGKFLMRRPRPRSAS